MLTKILEDSIPTNILLTQSYRVFSDSFRKVVVMIYFIIVLVNKLLSSRGVMYNLVFLCGLYGTDDNPVYMSCTFSSIWFVGIFFWIMSRGHKQPPLGGGVTHLVPDSMGTMCNPQYFQIRPPQLVHIILTDIQQNCMNTTHIHIHIFT